MTLVEITVSAAILALVLVNVQLVSRVGSDAAESGILQASIDDELDLTLDRMTLALMGSKEDELSGPGPAPSNSTFIDYTTLLGHEDGKPILGPTESIVWEQGVDLGTIRWTQTDLATEGLKEGGAVAGGMGLGGGTPPPTNERTVTWSQSVPTAYKGELLENIEDDNENGLLNERGLAFTVDGAKVEIHLTIEHVGDGGKRLSREKKHRITCRN